MKKYFIAVHILFFIFARSQVGNQKIENTKKWFDDFTICKCISYNYWQKGYKIEDESVKFWNEKTPISASNMEILEDFISKYSKGQNKNATLNNCLKIKKNQQYNLLIEKIIKSDLVLKEADYKLPKF